VRERPNDLGDDERVLLLIPPSEAKVPGGDGPSLVSGAADDTGSDALAVARRRVLVAVASFCRRSPGKARVALKLPPGSAAGDLAANIAALTAPTMPALDRFSGVLFAALDMPSLTARQRERAVRSVLVFSGAFGALAGGEPVPVHRVPASATVPRLGGLTTYWKKALAPVMAPLVEDAGLVIDLRSSDYAAMWRPTPAQARQVLTVRVLEERGGSLRAVSWSAKHGKGLLVRELLHSHTSRTPVRSLAQVVAAAERIGYDARPRPAVAGSPGLDLIIT
jgi:uncharacterized protein